MLKVFYNESTKYSRKIFKTWNLVLFYDFYKLTINWLCEHFYNQKACAFVIRSYDGTIEKLDEKNIKKYVNYINYYWK